MQRLALLSAPIKAGISWPTQLNLATFIEISHVTIFHDREGRLSSEMETVLYARTVRRGLAALSIISFVFGMNMPQASWDIFREIWPLLRSTKPMEVAKFIVSIVAIGISVAAILISVSVTKRLKMQDVIYERRKLFINTLWDKLIAVRSIQPNNATSDRVVELLNTLELVAFCWESEVADRELIARAFGKAYGEMVDNIQGITEGKGYDKVIDEIGTGPNLLKHQYTRVLPARKNLDQFLIAKGIS
jgi:hypothetical protein